MPLDAVCLTALCRELAPQLTGARIDRINMPERDLLILSLHLREGGNRKLLISARNGSARLHFTDKSFENPAQPPMFCMLLRKYLTGARIESLEQPRMERMVTLLLDTRDEMGDASQKRLVLELMGRGVNLVLVGGDGRILDCLRRVDMTAGERRPLLPGLFYAPPPREDKPCFFDLTPDERLRLYESAAGEEKEERMLHAFTALSPLWCRELTAGGDVPAAMERLAGLVERGDYTPTLLREGERARDFSFVPIRQYGDYVRTETYPSFSQLLDAFYTSRDQQEVLKRRSSDLTRAAKTARDRLLRKMDVRQRELKATEKREEYRRTADLITANIYRLKKGMHSFETQDFYAEGCPTVTVTLDERKTPQQNAARYYKMYTKAKTANRVLTELIEESGEEIRYLDSVLHEISRAETERDLSEIRQELVDGGYLKSPGRQRRNSTARRQPLRFVTDGGREVLVGRSNTENDQLTLRTARRGDLWFHVQKLPGSHVILSQSEGEAGEEDIRQAAILAATYSQSGGGKTAVDFTQVRHVRKIPGARPGMVIYTEQQTVLAEPDPVLAQRLRKS